MTVTLSDDPAQALQVAGRFLSSDPVRHNVILTLLHARMSEPEPGRYWVIRRQDGVKGVVLQSPLSLFANLTPMDEDAIVEAVAAIVDSGIRLPGVRGSAATAARFAGEWVDRTGWAAAPADGTRIYELSAAPMVPSVSGRIRQAASQDRNLVQSWMQGFYQDIGESGADASRMVDTRLALGQFWLWMADVPVSLAGVSLPADGVVRIQAAYTPPELRNRGYASACVATVSKLKRSEGLRCILYTDLANPISNRIYRRIGYRAISEGLSYSFVSDPRAEK